MGLPLTWNAVTRPSEPEDSSVGRVVDQLTELLPTPAEFEATQDALN